MNITITPKEITKENFSKFGDMITTDGIDPIEINEGFALLAWLGLGSYHMEWANDNMQLKLHSNPDQSGLFHSFVQMKRLTPALNPIMISMCQSPLIHLATSNSRYLNGFGTKPL